MGDFFFFKQKTAYELRISDWSSDVCSSDLFTFGEGYHNFHHEFQHDYRNGVKAWQFDPTKWCIWLLHKVQLARQLRRVPYEKILLTEVAEQIGRASCRERVCQYV